MALNFSKASMSLTQYGLYTRTTGQLSNINKMKDMTHGIKVGKLESKVHYTQQTMSKIKLSRAME